MWSCYFFIRTLQPHAKLYDSIYSGLLTGLSILFLQHKGFVLFVVAFTTLGILWLKERTRTQRDICIAYLLSTLLVIAALLIVWPIAVLYNNLILPLFSYSENQPIELFYFILFSLVICMPLVLLWKKATTPVRFLLALQATLFIAAEASMNLVHISFILAPLYILLPFLIDTTLAALSIAGVTHLVFFGVAFFFILQNAIATEILSPPFSEIDTRPLRLVVDRFCPGAYIYAGPFTPAVYFEARKLNPTPYYMLLDDSLPSHPFTVARDNLMELQPSCAILDYSRVGQFGYDQNNILEQYIRTHYKIRGALGTSIFMTRI